MRGVSNILLQNVWHHIPDNTANSWKFTIFGQFHRCDCQMMHTISTREFSFAREKEQSIPMSINDFVGMTIFLCLIWFYIYPKIHRWMCIFFFLFFFFACYAGNSRWGSNMAGKRFLGKKAIRLCVKINLFCTISEIIVFLRFTQKFKMAAKNGRENNFWGKSPVDCRYPAGQKFCQNRFISHSYRDECLFDFYAEIQDGHQKWRENDFWGKSPVDSPDTLQIKTFAEITLSRTVYEINGFLYLTQKFKMAAKSGRKVIFGKSRQ